MKILISHSYFLSLDPKEALLKKPYPPLATLYLSAWITQELNLEVKIYDVMFDKDEKGLVRCIKKFQPDVFILYDDDFNYLSKMCLENMRKAIFRGIRDVPKRGLFVAHGSDASNQPEEYLRSGFDFVAHKNAEKIILGILKIYTKPPSVQGLKTLPGLSFLEKGNFRQNPPQEENMSLEKAPMPSWDKITIGPYREMWVSHHNYFSLNISTSQGCPFSCNWCAKPLYGKTYRAFPAQRIVRQFYYIVTQFGVNHIWITDDIFALEPGWINEFADELERLKIRVPYKCQNRADLITEKFAFQLARSGCDEVWLGVESGSQKVLDAMEKGVTISQIKEANQILKKHKIKVGFFIQYGYPGEDIKDIKKTLGLIKECLPEFIGISVSYPLKGTPFYQKVAARMGEKKTWTDSGDLTLMFSGTYHPDFYRALYKYTHLYFTFISLIKKQPVLQEMERLSQHYKYFQDTREYKKIMGRYR